MGKYTIYNSVEKMSKKFLKNFKKVVDKSISLWYYMQAVCERAIAQAANGAANTAYRI